MFATRPAAADCGVNLADAPGKPIISANCYIKGMVSGENDTLTFPQPAPVSSLGVPAPAGMNDWYESMSRAAIRDGLSSRHAGSPNYSLL